MLLEKASTFVRRKTIERLEIDFGSLIVDDEFYKKDGKPYAERSVERLFNLKEDFCSNANILYNLVFKCISVTCPVCGSVLKLDGASGNGDFYTFKYQCGSCENKINLSIPDDGMSFRF